jgi:histidyl-tRNA synthetase
MHQVAALFGYQQIDTPIFEETAVYVRGVGQGTDIVDKEMYSFQDKGGADITLRPEFTAGVMRAYIEHGMHVWPQPVKLYSIGPIFRYERRRPVVFASTTSSTSRPSANKIRPWTWRS